MRACVRAYVRTYVRVCVCVCVRERGGVCICVSTSTGKEYSAPMYDLFDAMMS